MSTKHLVKIISSLLFSSDYQLSTAKIQEIIEQQSGDKPNTEEITQAIEQIKTTLNELAIDISQTASGYRMQTQAHYAPWVSSLWKEKVQKYPKSLIETLALIAYRQPITRGEIEYIRGVSVNTQTIRTLIERKWIRIIGYKEVPGKPAIYGTTKDFLDYFNLKSISELPSLPKLQTIEEADQNIKDLIN